MPTKPSPLHQFANNTANSQIPVVLVHGIWNTAAIFNSLNSYLTQNGWCVYATSLIPNNGDAPIEALAAQVATFIKTTFDPEQPIHLIGFSMGGLISRYYLQRLNGLTRVKTFIAISAPHQGTILAFGSNRPGVQQMRPNSPFLKDLNEDIHCLGTIQTVSFWTFFDIFILPPWHAKLPLGHTQRLNILSHNKMIRDPKGLYAIASSLDPS